MVLTAHREDFSIANSRVVGSYEQKQ